MWHQAGKPFSPKRDSEAVWPRMQTTGGREVGIFRMCLTFRVNTSPEERGREREEHKGMSSQEGTRQPIQIPPKAPPSRIPPKPPARPVPPIPPKIHERGREREEPKGWCSQENTRQSFQIPSMAHQETPRLPFLPLERPVPPIPPKPFGYLPRETSGTRMPATSADQTAQLEVRGGWEGGVRVCEPPAWVLRDRGGQAEPRERRSGDSDSGAADMEMPKQLPPTPPNHRHLNCRKD